ncbi:hypothetical protein HBB16_10835, partial [Pseudonocardia sp. MCCB 268]|nr:hypothetical protein [Pseudonocardia cytotoxica]
MVADRCRRDDHVEPHRPRPPTPSRVSCRHHVPARGRGGPQCLCTRSAVPGLAEVAAVVVGQQRVLPGRSRWSSRAAMRCCRFRCFCSRLFNLAIRNRNEVLL